MIWSELGALRDAAASTMTRSISGRGTGSSAFSTPRPAAMWWGLGKAPDHTLTEMSGKLSWGWHVLDGMIFYRFRLIVAGDRKPAKTRLKGVEWEWRYFVDSLYGNGSRGDFTAGAEKMFSLGVSVSAAVFPPFSLSFCHLLDLFSYLLV